MKAMLSCTVILKNSETLFLSVYVFASQPFQTFSTFYYVMDALEQIVKFDFNLELPATPATEKAAEVKKLSQIGPGVVHCISTLYDELKKLDLEMVEADDNVNQSDLESPQSES